MLIDVDPNAPHAEECNWWHGGVCDCTPAMRAARDRDHCHECDYVNAYSGSALCNCEGQCICEREAGCPCVGRLLAPVAALPGELALSPASSETHRPLEDQ